MFTWFRTKRSFDRAIGLIADYRRATEAWIERHDVVSGFCNNCQQILRFDVRSAGYYGKHPNLREAMRCQSCGLTNRNRLLLQAAVESDGGTGSRDTAVLERLSPLFVALSHQFPDIRGSEYLDGEHAPGQCCEWNGCVVRHESFTSLSYPSSSLDLLLHSDVLEHVFDYRKALGEAVRVLRPNGGTMLCTLSLFLSRTSSMELARPQHDGTVTFHVPPEFHGDSLRPDGILTWHHFGWDLLQAALDAGFRESAFGLNYDPFQGFVTNNHPDTSYGLMYPLVFMARK